MNPITELAPGAQGSPSGNSQAQAQLLASVVAQQRVIAAGRSADSGDAEQRNFSQDKEKERIMSAAKGRDQQADALRAQEQVQTRATADEQARSVVEAKEAAEAESASSLLANRKITAAFQGRHAITDLLSVIRDPEDKLLPKDPEGLAG